MGGEKGQRAGRARRREYPPKVNRALPIDRAPVDPKHNGDGGKPHLVTEKLPLIDEEMSEELANILKIHQPPELSAI